MPIQSSRPVEMDIPKSLKELHRMLSFGLEASLVKNYDLGKRYKLVEHLQQINGTKGAATLPLSSGTCRELWGRQATIRYFFPYSPRGCRNVADPRRSHPTI